MLAFLDRLRTDETRGDFFETFEHMWEAAGFSLRDYPRGLIEGQDDNGIEYDYDTEEKDVLETMVSKDLFDIVKEAKKNPIRRAT